MANPQFPGRLSPFPPPNTTKPQAVSCSPAFGGYVGAPQQTDRATVQLAPAASAPYPGSGMPGEPWKRPDAPEARRLRRER